MHVKCLFSLLSFYLVKGSEKTVCNKDDMNVLQIKVNVILEMKLIRQM